MARPTKSNLNTKTKQDLLLLIGRYPDGIGKREIARELKIGAKKRTWLNSHLNKLMEEGFVSLRRGGNIVLSSTLPQVTVIEVTDIDQNGDLLSKPVNWRKDQDPPLIYVKTSRRHQAPGCGDRLLARLTRLDDQTYNAVIIRRLESEPKTFLGIFGEDNCVHPVLRGKKLNYNVARIDMLGAEVGELVVAKTISRSRHGPQKAKILERLGRENGPNAYSHIAIHLNRIPYRFSEEALEQASMAGAAVIEGQTDLRKLPLVTIDGEDARDFDDAVFAEPWQGAESGWHVIVAIADVAWYVSPGTALDSDAKERGNSVYFPDRVVPMLPESLSNGWCSLKPNQDRPCLTAHIWTDALGNITHHKIERAVIRSHARLTYSQVQAARDGHPDPQIKTIMEDVINPLYGAYEGLLTARQRREPLELNVPEAVVKLDNYGKILRVIERPNLESHKLIEEFMIAANIVAAETLKNNQQSFLYRVHEEPPKDKLDAFRDFSDSLRLKLPRGQVVRPSHFNKLIERATKLDMGSVISGAVLRAQSKARYTPEDRGHFGLALRHYCHFTSPIRRYADLLVHRALISVLNLGDGGEQADPRELEQIGSQLSLTEKRAANAERETIDRFSAAFFMSRVGQEIRGTISGVARFGLFVSLDGCASEGLVPIRYLPNERYQFDEKRQLLKSHQTGLIFRIGDQINLVIKNANPINRSITLAFLGPATDRSEDHQHKLKVENQNGGIGF